jgi:anti-sigma-K factor RskA
MSDEGTMDPGNGQDLAAAEYVLGVLSAADRRTAELRLARDPAFAADVAFWEARLGGLADGVAQVAPPPELWRSIEAKIAAQAASRRHGLWESLAFWRTLAIASATVAAASFGGLFYLARLPSVGPPLVASLEEKSGQPGFVAAANPADGSLTIVPAALLTGEEQRAYELWVIPPGGTPHSLGLVDPAKPVKVVVPPELLPHVSANSVLAISLEPAGGSPTGQPTGPIIANGKLASL